ncbi:hypothetical protein [Amycolatopsis rubida]|nr:hypothetical protein [Amycolatopsis rubida]
MSLCLVEYQNPVNPPHELAALVVSQAAVIATIELSRAELERMTERAAELERQPAAGTPSCPASPGPQRTTDGAAAPATSPARSATPTTRANCSAPPKPTGQDWRARLSGFLDELNAAAGELDPRETPRQRPRRRATPHTRSHTGRTQGGRPGQPKTRARPERPHRHREDVLRFPFDLTVPFTSNQSGRDTRMTKRDSTSPTGAPPCAPASPPPREDGITPTPHSATPSRENPVCHHNRQLPDQLPDGSDQLCLPSPDGGSRTAETFTSETRRMDI